MKLLPNKKFLHVNIFAVTKIIASVKIIFHSDILINERLVNEMLVPENYME